MKFKKTLITVAAIAAVLIASISSVAVYAEDNALAGDANRDGKVNILDATFVQKVIAELEAEPENFKEAADVNLDGKVNILDATIIQKYIAEYITELPISVETPTGGDITIPTTTETPADSNVTIPTTTATTPTESTSRVRTTDIDGYDTRIIQP